MLKKSLPAHFNHHTQTNTTMTTKLKTMNLSIYNNKTHKITNITNI